MKPPKKSNINELNEKRFRALIENAHEGIVQYDVEGVIVFASKSVKKVCGFTEKEVVGKTGTYFLHPDDRALAGETFFKLLKKPGASATIIQRIRHKKGGYIWSESLLTNFSHIPEIKGIVSNFRDVTEKKITEEKIFQTQELLQTITRNLSEGIYMGIIGSKLIYVNDGFLKLLGYKSFKEIANVKPAEFYADQKHREQIINDLRKHHHLRNVETLFRMKSGEAIPVVINVNLLVHEGKANYFVGNVRDISKDKRSERELLDSRTFLRNIINTVAAPIFVKDSKHRFVIVNEKFQELVGHDEANVLGKTDKHFVSESEAKVFWKIDDQVLKSGKTNRNLEKITAASGEVLDLLTVKSLYVNENKERFIIGFITDITPLRKTEEKVHQLNANLQGVLESTQESVYAVDQNFSYIMFNQNHKRIMKALYGADITVGSHKISFLKGSNDFRWVKSELERAMKGNHFASEHFIDYPKYKGYIQTTFNPIYDRNGKVKGVAVFVNNITQRKEYEEIISSMNANLSAVIESTSDRICSLDRNLRYVSFNTAHAKRVKIVTGREIKIGDYLLEGLAPELAEGVRRNFERALNGEQIIIEAVMESEKSTMEVTYNPIYSTDRKVTGVAMFVRDITERKRIENTLKVLNEELIHQNSQLAAQEEELKATLDELSERNFELDQLMYKTSHDLRSPLSSIMGLVNLARLDRAGAHQEDYLTKIEDRIKKLDEFIRSMLDYARVNRVEVSYEEVDLQEVVKKCVHELEYLENFSDVKVDVEANMVKPVIVCDPLRIHIIFSNIISNAYKYNNPDVTSYLKIKIEGLSQFTEIKFKDNGIGIKDEYVGKIFNMFFRATERSQGSGLGMYIVQQAIEKLGGSVRLESEYGKGTEIVIRLPNQVH
jgi:PAS domain S-box-containing protein